MVPGVSAVGVVTNWKKERILRSLCLGSGPGPLGISREVKGGKTRWCARRSPRSLGRRLRRERADVWRRSRSTRSCWDLGWRPARSGEDLWSLNRSCTRCEALPVRESVESGRDFRNGLPVASDLRCNRVTEIRLDNGFRENARLGAAVVLPEKGCLNYSACLCVLLV